jgi:hypothetical protein
VGRITTSAPSGPATKSCLPALLGRYIHRRCAGYSLVGCIFGFCAHLLALLLTAAACRLLPPPAVPQCCTMQGFGFWVAAGFCALRSMSWLSLSAGCVGFLLGVAGVFRRVLSWLSLALLGGREPRHSCRVHSKDQPEPLAGSSL